MLEKDTIGINTHDIKNRDAENMNRLVVRKMRERIYDPSVFDRMSESEKEVADYLKNELNIYWRYEQPVFVWDERHRPRTWTPDFYLPDLGLYVEVCGIEREKSYEYRKEIYEGNEIYVVFVKTYREKSKWQDHLRKYIRSFTERRYEKTMEIVKSFSVQFFR